MSALQALKAVREAGVRIGVNGAFEADNEPPAALLDFLLRYKASALALLHTGIDGWSGEDWWALCKEHRPLPSSMMESLQNTCMSRVGRVNATLSK